jgi:hypothetical protein
MYRNKAAHLGPLSYPEFGFRNNAGGLSLFIPRCWPFVPEQQMAAVPASTIETEAVDLSDLMNQWLVHQDLEEYSEGAFRKIQKVVAISFAVLKDAYLSVRCLPDIDQTAADLQKNRKEFKFEFFEEVG